VVEAPRQLTLDANEERLYRAVSDEARHLDELADDVGMPAGLAGAVMLTLELKGLVRNHGAQYYVKR
jgi:DNA processing protein